MKIPDKIRIGGIDYKVEFVEHLNDGQKVLNGQISYNDSVIRINRSNLSHQMSCITMWHEIIHGIAVHAGLDLNKEDSEEHITDVIARGVYQVLQDNGRLLFDIEKGDKQKNVEEECKMRQFSINTGQLKDLHFTGRHIAEVSSRWEGGEENHPWYELALYQTAAGKYVLATARFTYREGEKTHNEVWVCATIKEVVDVMLDRLSHVAATAKALLRAAARVDSAFQGTWLEEIE